MSDQVFEVTSVLALLVVPRQFDPEAAACPIHQADEIDVRPVGS